MKTLTICLLVAVAAALGTVPVQAQNEDWISEQQASMKEDELMFEMVDLHTRTIERCMAEITRMSNMDPGAHKVTRNQEDHYSNKLARNVRMKEEAAEAIEEIIYSHFMQVRLGNWPGVKMNEEGYASEGYKTYTKMLEYLHSATVYTLWCKELTMSEKPRAVRNYMAKFRALWMDPTYKASRRGNGHN